MSISANNGIESDRALLMCLPCGLPITWWYLLRRSSRPSCARRKPVSTRGGLESFPFRVYRRNLICTYVAYRSIVRENTDGPRIHLFSVGCKIPVLETLPKSFFLNESPESSKQSSRLGLWTSKQSSRLGLWTAGSPTQRHSRPSVFFSILGSAKALRDRQQVRGPGLNSRLRLTHFQSEDPTSTCGKSARTNSLLHLSGEIQTS